MILKLAGFVLLHRPVLLTDWLEAPTELKHWVFAKLGWMQAVHSGVCPGWCPCEIDLGLDEDERAAA